MAVAVERVKLPRGTQPLYASVAFITCWYVRHEGITGRFGSEAKSVMEIRANTSYINTKVHITAAIAVYKL
jgi:hypothetical protein